MCVRAYARCVPELSNCIARFEVSYLRLQWWLLHRRVVIAAQAHSPSVLLLRLHAVGLAAIVATTHTGPWHHSVHILVQWQGVSFVTNSTAAVHRAPGFTQQQYLTSGLDRLPSLPARMHTMMYWHIRYTVTISAVITLHGSKQQRAQRLWCDEKPPGQLTPGMHSSRYDCPTHLTVHLWSITKTLSGNIPAFYKQGQRHEMLPRIVPATPFVLQGKALGTSQTCVTYNGVDQPIQRLGIQIPCNRDEPHTQL